jgi:uncharacterized protein (TIGR02722 family)
MMTRTTFPLAVLILALALAGCASSGGSSVRRVPVDEATDLSGRWNDTDARLVAEAMIDDVLRGGWLFDYQQGAASAEAKPVVIVGPVENRTMEHIDTGVFIKDLERELVNAGEVTFVAAPTEREALRAERLDQQQYASPETAAALARELGADYMLLGAIRSIVDEAPDGEQAAVFYTVDLELVDIESNAKAWIGTKKIKKVVARGRYRW